MRSPDTRTALTPSGPLRRIWPHLALPLAHVVAVLALCSVFFLCIGRNPLEVLWIICVAAFGDGYAITETLVKAAPILLCALATAVPARLGLISVGAEGQLYFGALLGTGFVLQAFDAPGFILLPGMLLAGAAAGAAWALVCGVLKATLEVNETISTLLLNYVAALLVTWVVFGAWKDPASQGWPASREFPATAHLSTYFDSRIHAGLWIGLVCAVLLHIVLTRSRWGLELDVLRSNPRAGRGAGLRFERNVLVVMALGGALAGLAGIIETANIQGRLQSNLSGGAGFSGFLVAWLARNDCLRIAALSLLVGGLLASGDAMQMLAQLPSSVAQVVQALLFIGVLLVNGWTARRPTLPGRA